MLKIRFLQVGTLLALLASCAAPPPNYPEPGSVSFGYNALQPAAVANTHGDAGAFTRVWNNATVHTGPVDLHAHLLTDLERIDSESSVYQRTRVGASLPGLVQPLSDFWLVGDFDFADELGPLDQLVGVRYAALPNALPVFDYGYAEMLFDNDTTRANIFAGIALNDRGMAIELFHLSEWDTGDGKWKSGYQRGEAYFFLDRIAERDRFGIRPYVAVHGINYRWDETQFLAGITIDF